MTTVGKALIFAAGCLALTLATRAAVKHPDAKPEVATEVAGTDEVNPADELSPDNPYAAIVQRNVFDLHDPPPQVEKPVEKPPPSNIKLTGITTIFGNKQALFIVSEPGAAGKQPTTRSLILKEGQRSGPLEVVEINPKTRKAIIKNDGVESTLNIETNKAVAVGSPAGGTPGAHAAGYAAPGVPNKGGGERSLPPRAMRTGGAENFTPQPNTAPQPAYAAVPQAYNQPVAQQSLPTPEEQNILTELQRAQSLAGLADPNIAKMLPPTSLNPQPSPSAPETPQAPATPGPPLGSRTSGSFLPPTP